MAELHGHRHFAKVCHWARSGCEIERLGSMTTPEYYRKQIELLLDWADTVTNAELQISLIQRALTFYHSQIGLMIKRSSVFKKGCITLQCPATR